MTVGSVCMKEQEESAVGGIYNRGEKSTSNQLMILEVGVKNNNVEPGARSIYKYMVESRRRKNEEQSPAFKVDGCVIMQSLCK